MNLFRIVFLSASGLLVAGSTYLGYQGVGGASNDLDKTASVRQGSGGGGYYYSNNRVK
ncbi:hypothetical protein TRP8649_04383 [Pelagimonas phthalicica]|uniref:Uncharacterized protein n=1 Tax=Pelagimonas phthalicica TaxID=1037362 RepID=A0A238JHU4_9RHOB|nr:MULTISPECIES: hypothetical protein [Roseobacteraceae]MBO9467671.1 hypothetical protein [Tropicibacter sp. R15_0]TDS90072.1 hypothetical protein CLV87_4129 [Pelagimonas phthalicica]SMX30240.1 hypothetical protein TRP8649_04383 [Pelagimonas phthalicica]